jgi:hypothetical protein
MGRLLVLEVQEVALSQDVVLVLLLGIAVGRVLVVGGHILLLLFVVVYLGNHSYIFLRRILLDNVIVVV